MKVLITAGWKKPGAGPSSASKDYIDSWWKAHDEYSMWCPDWKCKCSSKRHNSRHQTFKKKVFTYLWLDPQTDDIPEDGGDWWDPRRIKSKQGKSFSGGKMKKKKKEQLSRWGWLICHHETALNAEWLCLETTVDSEPITIEIKQVKMEKVLRSVWCRNRIRRYPSPQNSQLGGIVSQAVSGAPGPHLILRCFSNPPFSHRYSLLPQHWETSVTLGETLTREVCPRDCGGCVSRMAALAAPASVPCGNQIWSSGKDIRAGTGWPPCDPSSTIWPPLSCPIFYSLCELFQMKQTDGVREDRLKWNEKKKWVTLH